MSREFEIIKKKNLPDEAKIIGFSFLKEPTKEDKEKNKYDFCTFSNGNEIGCMLSKRNSYAFHKGYVKVDNNMGEYVEVKTRWPFILLFLLGLGVGVALLCSTPAVDTPDTPVGTNKPIFDLTQDSNAQEGEREKRPQEEIQAELNQKVQEGMINISMNLSPIFENGTSKGNLLIVNEEINRHPQVIEIYRKDTNELIYKSGLIPVGSRVDEGSLLVDLDAGEYPCVAYFNSVNGETGELLGKAGAEINIIVKG